MSFAIRRVVAADLDQLIELCRLHADYEQSPFIEDGQSERLAAAFFSTEPKLYGWVVEGANSRLCGYMTLVLDYATWTARPFIYLDCLFLREQVRGQGLGRQLIGQMRLFMAEHGCTAAEWHTPPGNATGIGFYRGLGATEKPKIRFFYDATTESRKEMRQ